MVCATVNPNEIVHGDNVVFDAEMGSGGDVTFFISSPEGSHSTRVLSFRDIETLYHAARAKRAGR
ncbi:MAG: hypothetical protein ACREAU_00435 [Nitrosopumilaceae archaeon]